jgi:hypothetical protein
MPPTDQLLPTKEVAGRLRRPEATLRYWRAHGVGPACFKIGKHVVYSEAALEAWIDQQRQRTGVSGGAV